MSNTGAARAWRFLMRNPDYAAERKAAAGAAAPPEAEPFPMRRQSPSDRGAAAWGLMAWEDPLPDDGRTAPFWTEAPALRGFPVPGAPPLTELLAGPEVRLAGLWLEDGGAVVKVERGEASVQIRIDAGEGFDPAGGVAVCLNTGLDLGVRLHRAGDLWPIAAVETKKEGTGAVFASRTRSC